MPVREAGARCNLRIDNHIPQAIRPHSRVNSETVTSTPQALRMREQLLLLRSKRRRISHLYAALRNVTLLKLKP